MWQTTNSNTVLCPKLNISPPRTSSLRFCFSSTTRSCTKQILRDWYPSFWLCSCHQMQPVKSNPWNVNNTFKCHFSQQLSRHALHKMDRNASTFWNGFTIEDAVRFINKARTRCNNPAKRSSTISSLLIDAKCKIVAHMPSLQ